MIDLSVDSVTEESSITDVNQNAVVGGIAVVGVTGSGTWSYATDGVMFQAITSAGSASALLLAHDAKLRYTPGGAGAETPTITFMAWDATAGSNGGRVDLSSSSATGGTTAFSSVADTATLTVADVTDATVLTQAAPSLGSTASGTAKTIGVSGTFINNGTGTTSITVANTSAVAGGIALTEVTGYGTWEYSLDGTTFLEVTGVSDTWALLLSKDGMLRYTPYDASEETATITYRAWDSTAGASGDLVDLSAEGAVGGTTGYSLFADSASLTVNDAPILTAASPSMGSTDEDTPITISLSETFINNDADTGTIITDANENSLVGGIAITAVTGNGTWAYSLDGSTFSSVETVATNSALLLPTTATLRYTPDGSTAETATVTYCAWDTTSGSSGSKVDTTTNGGATAFSTASDTASLTVNGATTNNAPDLTPASPSLGSTTPDTAATFSLTDTFIDNGDDTTVIADADTDAVLGGIAVIGVTGNGTWAYSLDGSSFTSLGTVSSSSALLLPSTASLRYTPDGTSTETATIAYRAWDTTTGTSGSKVDTTTNGDTTAFSADTDTASLTVDAGTATISGYVYIDSNNDGQRGHVEGHLPPRLFRRDRQAFLRGRQRNLDGGRRKVAVPDGCGRLLQLQRPGCGCLPDPRDSAAEPERRAGDGRDHFGHGPRHRRRRPDRGRRRSG